MNGNEKKIMIELTKAVATLGDAVNLLTEKLPADERDPVKLKIRGTMDFLDVAIKIMQKEWQTNGEN